MGILNWLWSLFLQIFGQWFSKNGEDKPQPEEFLDSALAWMAIVLDANQPIPGDGDDTDVFSTEMERVLEAYHDDTDGPPDNTDVYSTEMERVLEAYYDVTVDVFSIAFEEALEAVDTDIYSVEMEEALEAYVDIPEADSDDDTPVVPLVESEPTLKITPIDDEEVEWEEFVVLRSQQVAVPCKKYLAVKEDEVVFFGAFQKNDEGLNPWDPSEKKQLAQMRKEFLDGVYESREHIQRSASTRL